MVFVLLPIVVSMMSTAAIDACSNKSTPPVAAFTTLTRHNVQHKAQQQHQQPSHSLSSRSQGPVGQSGLSERPVRCKSALSFLPADIGGAATLLSIKMDGAKAIANPTQVLADASYVLRDGSQYILFGYPDLQITDAICPGGWKINDLGHQFPASSWSPSRRNGSPALVVEREYETDDAVGATI